MTPNELAAMLRKCPIRSVGDVNIHQIADVIDQQQAQIDKYKYKDIAQMDRISILEAQVKHLESQVYGGTTK